MRKLLLEERDERLKQKICPRCKKFNLVETSLESYQRPHVRYKMSETLWSCSSPSGPFCYILAGEKDSTIFETSDEVEPVEFFENKSINSTKVIRRRGGEVFEVRTLHTASYAESNSRFC